MKEPLDESYFKWLYSQVANPHARNPRATHWQLCKILYKKEFVWIVPNDDNRIEDGKDLRYEFVDAQRLQNVDPSWVNLPCSMLELLIGLSRRFSFEAEGEPARWFWEMMDNLELSRYHDRRDYSEDEVDEVLERVIFRTYSYSGKGGLFPLKNPEKDQRNVELWYQMSAYILENL